MRHRIVAVLLEQKRVELGESYREFGKRIYPDSPPDSAESNYCRIAGQYINIPRTRFVTAAEVLCTTVEILRSI